MKIINSHKNIANDITKSAIAIKDTLTLKLDSVRDNKIIKMKLDDIATISEMENVFHMNYEVKDRIKTDMATNGFNKAHPIHIFKWNGQWIVCDGHTRFCASKELGLKYVYAQIHNFKTLNEAKLYSMKEQFDRRNIEDSDLFKQYEALKTEENEGKKLTTAEMSERLKKSKRHIFKLQEVEKKSTPKQLEAIREGDRKSVV